MGNSDIPELDGEELLARARQDLMKSQPFFASLVKNLNFVEKEDIPTAAIDRYGNVYYNPEFMHTDRGAFMLPRHALGVLLHEVLHVALRGHERQSGRDDKKWNIAQDLIINNIVKKNGFELPDMIDDEMIPEDGVTELPDVGEVNVEEHSSESLYEIVDEAYDGDDMPISSFDEGVIGEEGDDEAPAAGDLQEEDIDWKREMSKAEQRAKERGEMPGGMDDRIDNAREGEVDYREIIQKKVSKAIPHDFTYQRPNKKYFSTGYYFPSTIQEDSVDVTVALDTSGSISDENLEEFLGEIVQLVTQFDAVDLKIIQHDADVQMVEEYDNADQRDFGDMMVKGRGGTDHVPVFEEIDSPEVLVCFTDGKTSVPEEPPSDITTNNIIWVINNYQVGRERLPYGRIVRAHADE